MPKRRRQTIYYLCWYQYYWAAIAKSIKSDELQYAQGHQHGVQPTKEQWNSLKQSLYDNVRAAGAGRRHPVAYPGDETVLGGSEKKTRSKHG